MKARLRRLLPVAGANAVPVAGVFLAGWSAATALTLYWVENLVGSLLVAVRIGAHEALTRKRGHRRLQLALQREPHAKAGEARRASKRAYTEPHTFLREF